MAEKYLRIDPSGDVSWINIDRVPYDFDPSINGLCLDQIYAAIGCSCFEQVRTIIPGVVLLVDESGKIKIPAQAPNELASRFYLGYYHGVDYISGPAIVAAMRPTPPIGEYDLFPLLPSELLKVELALGKKVPEIKTIMNA